MTAAKWCARRAGKDEFKTKAKTPALAGRQKEKSSSKITAEKYLSRSTVKVKGGTWTQVVTPKV